MKRNSASLTQVVDGVLSYIVTDQVGTPREMFSETGDLVWARRQKLWGADEGYLNLEAANDNAGHQTCFLRFQGQIEDEESGLYYNRFRYYDADDGYISPDPIGLIGGARAFGYVHNPSTYIDPLGLKLRDPNQIYYSQDSINSVFSDGTNVNNLMGKLSMDPGYAKEVKPIVLVRLSDLPTNIQNRLLEQGANASDVFSLDNRRLAAAKDANVPVNSRFAVADDLKDIDLNRRFSTKNAGRSISRGC